MDEQQKIWRYLGLLPFTRMLQQKGLYLSRPSELGDPFEGAPTPAHFDAVLRYVIEMVDAYSFMWHSPALTTDSLLNQAENPAKRKLVVGYLGQLREELVRLELHPDDYDGVWKQMLDRFGVSCWHANPEQSDAMWRIYAPQGQGVAIESTYGRLKKILHPMMAIENVVYEGDAAGGAPFAPLFQKRPAFAHERELRVIAPLVENYAPGRLLLCDLSSLVVRVHTAPGASPLFRDTVSTLCEDHGLPTPQKSSLDDDPPRLPGVFEKRRHIEALQNAIQRLASYADESGAT